MTSTENKNNPQGIIVLGVNIHCEGCANEVSKCLRGFEGVEGVEIDGKNNKVSVKGKMADPIKVTERLRKKISGKHVELISPKPPSKEEKKLEEKKPPEAELFEVVLKIYMHCEGCAKEVKHCILKMEGVQTVDPNMEKNEVCVKGIMNPQKLVEFIIKRGGRHAEVVKKTSVNTPGKQNKEDARSKMKKSKDDAAASTTSHDQLRLVYAPQLFSDENPNSCSLM
ncbi:hypothetical protein ACS0TY_034559 [Phlomoides rotata]